MMNISIDGSTYQVEVGERLIDVINRVGKELPQVCYHRQLGPIQTCDTCLVAVNRKLVRVCATGVVDGLRVETKSARADAAQREAFDRILSNHLLYCTVCDNNNGNCIIHNTTKVLKVEHQRIPFKPRPYEIDAVAIRTRRLSWPNILLANCQNPNGVWFLGFSQASLHPLLERFEGLRLE